jgi:hypothetical protein
MTARERPEPRSTFVLKIEGRPGAAGIRALRWLLKTLLRRHGFRCVEVSETVESESESFKPRRDTLL